jgi:phospholipid N-methyltransferase
LPPGKRLKTLNQLESQRHFRLLLGRELCSEQLRHGGKVKPDSHPILSWSPHLEDITSGIPIVEITNQRETLDELGAALPIKRPMVSAPQITEATHETDRWPQSLSQHLFMSP